MVNICIRVLRLIYVDDVEEPNQCNRLPCWIAIDLAQTVIADQLVEKVLVTQFDVSRTTVAEKNRTDKEKTILNGGMFFAPSAKREKGLPPRVSDAL